MGSQRFTVDDCLLYIDEVSALIRLSKPRIYALCRIGEFPKPIKIGRGRSAWIEREILEYINNRIQERDKKRG